MTPTADQIDFSAARRAMIDSQLRVSGVNEEWLLTAFAATPREDFVPAAARGHAYIDRAIPLDSTHALAAPLVHGRMLSEAVPAKADRTLIVSSGSGYLAELVRPLVGSLKVVSASDAAAGSFGSGPYDLILIDGAVEGVPDVLADSLDSAGRIVTGLVQRGVTRLATGRKAAGRIVLLPLAEIGIPVLHEFDAPKQWSF